MEHPFLRTLAIVSLSSMLFVQIAQATVTEETQDPYIDPYTDDSSIQLTLSGELSMGNAVLQWTKYEGEDLYYAYSRTDSGRYLFVIFIHKLFICKQCINLWLLF